MSDYKKDETFELLKELADDLFGLALELEVSPENIIEQLDLYLNTDDPFEYLASLIEALNTIRKHIKESKASLPNFRNAKSN